MNKKSFNIEIVGLSIHHSEELKLQLRHLISHDYMIKWVTASDQNIDCLFIHEHFYETEGIQRLIRKNHFPWLKVSKSLKSQFQIENDTLFLPITEQSVLYDWIKHHLMNRTQENYRLEEPSSTPLALLNKKFFLNLNDIENHSKLHLQDEMGTLAVIQPIQNIAWINPERATNSTNQSFQYDLANISDLTKVSRKSHFILQDWLWNLFWNSPEVLYNLTPDDGHYKIYSWPKPTDQFNRKVIFQLSACFIQGGKISKIAEQLQLPQNTVRHFVATNIATNNIEKINVWDKHYSPPSQEIRSEEKNAIKSFLGKLRQKFGF